MIGIALSRRTILKGAVGCLCCSALPAAALAQTAPAELTAQPIAEGLLLIRGGGGNVVVGVEPDGMSLVDSGLAERTPALLEFIRAETGQDRIKTLINTHWHAGQTGGNAAIGAQGAKIVSHVNTARYLSNDTWVRAEHRTYPALPAEGRPTETFYDTWTGAFGAGGVEAGYLLQAHTDGDVYVRFPGANVIVTGGAATSDQWPVIDWSTGGWIGGLRRAQSALLEIAADDTVIVPGLGPTMTKAELAAQHEMYVGLMDQLEAMMESGFGVSDVLAADPAAGLRPDWGDTAPFLTAAFKSFWGHVRQFDLV
jgi:glyoxylase-like metal-dependent hydrolase (beta-lactamase superfamily II)